MLQLHSMRHCVQARADVLKAGRRSRGGCQMAAAPAAQPRLPGSPGARSRAAAALPPAPPGNQPRTGRPRLAAAWREHRWTNPGCEGVRMEGGAGRRALSQTFSASSSRLEAAWPQSGRPPAASRRAGAPATASTCAALPPHRTLLHSPLTWRLCVHITFKSCTGGWQPATL